MRSLFAAGLSIFLAVAVSSAQFAVRVRARWAALMPRRASAVRSVASVPRTRALSGLVRIRTPAADSARASAPIRFPYAYSVYVPGYFDTLGDQGYYPPVSVSSAARPPPAILR